MADFDVAFHWTMKFEDPKMAWAQAPDAVPEGCRGPCYAIGGINSGLWPNDFASIRALPQHERAAAIAAFYQARYWNPWLAKITSDNLAKRVFDFGVNGGAATAVRTVQKAVNALGVSLAVDGGWGQKTLAAVNAADPAALVEAFISARAAHYQAIAASDPGKARYLSVWLARARA